MVKNNLYTNDQSGIANTATIVSTRQIGDLQIEVDNAIHFPKGIFHFATHGTTGSTYGNVVDQSSICAMTGTASGNTITIVGFDPGYTDKGNLVGQSLVLRPTAGWGNEVAAILDRHEQSSRDASQFYRRYNPGNLSGATITPSATGLAVVFSANDSSFQLVGPAGVGNADTRVCYGTFDTTLTLTAPASGSTNYGIIVWAASSRTDHGVDGVIAVGSPTDTSIRTAIGVSGATAYYGIVANIAVDSGRTSATNLPIIWNQAELPSQDIDFATFKNYSTLLPHATISNVSLGFGMQGRIHRYGDMVFLKFNNGGSYNINSGTNSLGETIPIGYRPMDDVTINLARGGGGTGQSVVYTIYPSGAMSLYSAITLSNEFLVGGYAFWITSDAWPS